jgi:hypothetical protein
MLYNHIAAQIRFFQPLSAMLVLFPTMITGISIATLGMAILSLRTSIWVFIAGIFIFSIGEVMNCSSKIISYLGLIDLPTKKLPIWDLDFSMGFLGSSIGGIVGAFLMLLSLIIQ